MSSLRPTIVGQIVRFSVKLQRKKRIAKNPSINTKMIKPFSWNTLKTLSISKEYLIKVSNFESGVCRVKVGVMDVQ